MEIFAGVRWRGGVKWEWGSWKWRLSFLLFTVFWTFYIHGHTTAFRWYDCQWLRAYFKVTGLFHINFLKNSVCDTHGPRSHGVQGGQLTPTFSGAGSHNGAWPLTFCDPCVEKLVQTHLFTLSCCDFHVPKCTKFNIFRGSAPNPDGEAYTALPRPIAGGKELAAAPQEHLPALGPSGLALSRPPCWNLCLFIYACSFAIGQ